MRVAERVVVEARLHCRLAVVKRAAKGNVVDVRVDDRDHLELLGARGAPLGVHDEALNPLLPAQPVDRARPRVARCGAHDRNLLPRPHRQEVLKEIAKELEFPEDWRLAQDEQDDLIDRPDLDDLGPFRWSPSAAPEWQFSQANGEVIDSTKFSNKPVLVIYYLGRGCAHCMEQLNAFAPEADKYREAGIEIVAVSTDTVEGLAKTFQQGEGENPFPFPLVSDAENVGFKAFRAYDEFEDQALHGTFLVDGTGKIRWQDVSYEPFMHASWLLEESERLLATDAVIESLVATK